MTGPAYFTATVADNADPDELGRLSLVIPGLIFERHTHNLDAVGVAEERLIELQRVRLHVAAAHAELVKAPQGRKLARNGRFRITLQTQKREERLDLFGLRVAQLLLHAGFGQSDAAFRRGRGSATL